MHSHRNLPQLPRYPGTWSAEARCREATGQDPLAGLAVRWPLALRVTRAPGAPVHA
jgi:hypothetical protein